MIADHGAFNATAQPTKYPAGFFHIFTGSYDLEAAHCKVKGVYTNKAPGGVAYRCSFRVTEAVYLVERMVDALAHELGMDPAELRLKNFIRPEQFPYQSQDRLGLRLRRLRAGDAQGDGHRRLRRAAPRAGREARARRAHGHRHLVLHRDASAPGRARTWTSSGLGMADGAELRVHPTGKAVAAASARMSQGQGHETTFAQIVAEELGIPPEDIEVVNGDTDRTPFGLGHLRQPLDAGLRRGDGAGRAQGPRAGAPDRRRHAGGLARRPRVGEGPLVRQGRPGAGQDDPGDRAWPPTARSTCPRASRAHLEDDRRLQPAEPDVPVRRLHLRRRRRPGHRRRSRCGASSPSTTAACGSTR